MNRLNLEIFGEGVNCCFTLISGVIVTFGFGSGIGSRIKVAFGMKSFSSGHTSGTGGVVSSIGISGTSTLGLSGVMIIFSGTVISGVGRVTVGCSSTTGGIGFSSIGEGGSCGGLFVLDEIFRPLRCGL